MSQAIPANQTEREFWAAEGPQQYVEHGDRWETMMAPFGAAMFDFVALQPGKRVLDVGCGWGATTVEAADRVAPTGSVVGIDFSAQMLARAARPTADLANVTLLEADAQTHPFELASYDAVISRFAAMLFEDPPAAFANLHRALPDRSRSLTATACAGWSPRAASTRSHWSRSPGHSASRITPTTPSPSSDRFRRPGSC